MNHRNGFTLIEVIVILAVIAILASMAVPTALRLFEVTATSGTDSEMQNLRKAMLGDSTKIESGVRTDFGYLGDVGCLPTSLQDLITKPSGMNNYAFDPATQVGAGWRGPYITGTAAAQATAEFTNDQWGNAYTYTPSACAAPLAASLTAPFYSWGPNATDNTAGGDDISYALAATDTSSTVSGYVRDIYGNPVASSTVRINYPFNGSLTTAVSATTNSTGFYQFASVIPFGKRSITFPQPPPGTPNPKLVVTGAKAIGPNSGDGDCNNTGNNCTIVDFTLVNFSTTAVTGISSLTATYSSTCCASPGPWYYRIKWGTAFPFSDNNTGQGSGARALSPSQSVGAATSALAPVTVVIDNQSEQVPDIVLGKSGQIGTAVRVRIINFRDNAGGRNTGSQVAMGGVVFTITFSDGSTVYFTPTTAP